MSIVGCYTLHLYCDNGDRAKHDYKIQFPHEFTGHTAGECYRDSRAAGWKLDLVNRKAYCPLCVAAGNKPPTAR